MVEEYNSIMMNDVWEVVPRPKNKSVVGSQWIYKIKYATDDNIEKYKERFVANGYAQKKGIDYEETFALVARYTSIKSVISLAMQMRWKIHQMDVKTTFMNGVIKEEVYIEQLEGFETHEKNSHVCRLKKALYGFKQAPRAWIIQDCKKNLEAEFDMKDLGLMHYFLGLEVWQKNGEIFLGKGRYATNILKRFKMQDCRSMASPMITNWKKIDASEDKEVDPTFYRQLIGSLMYLVNTRPDIFFAVNTLSQFMVESKRVHWAVARRILRYVRGTIGYGLKYSRRADISLNGFIDADWVGNSIDRESTSGYCFSVGSGMISWCNRKQKLVALSSAEAEYMAANTTKCEAIWLRKLLVSLFSKRMEETKVHCDNQSCIKLFENPVFHDRWKHIDIHCHFIKDCV
eukprot:PITA_34522